jgi:hypothetical protein
MKVKRDALIRSLVECHRRIDYFSSASNGFETVGELLQEAAAKIKAAIKMLENLNAKTKRASNG